MTVVVTHSTPADGSFSTTGATAWNANHTLSGVGTMAGQDANSVAITGGSISGVSGVVSGVTGTAPVVSSGGTTPAISMAAATTSVDGYLTSADWTTFNGKQAALVSGTNIKTVNSNSLLGSGNVSVGTVTSVGGTGTVNGLSLSGTVTSSGNLTFGGTLDLSSPPAIGGTAAAAGSFTTLIGGSGSANYEQITGGATGKAVQFQSLGSDAAVSLAIQSKGTGAIDLAAGSSGVNISNGGTVTALTRTATGSGYTSTVTWNASAPTTAGGATASGTVTITTTGNPTVTNGGTGYTVNDVLTIVGGTVVSVAGTLTVTAVSSGVITAATYTNFAQYTAAPTNPVSVTGGTGSGATFTLSFGITTNLTISNAGSGYVEQPTVTFSGGGGSGAAAYAVVGSQTIVKGLGTSTGTQTNQSIMFQTPAGNALLIRDAGNTVDAHVLIQGTGNGYGFISGEGTNANASLILGAKAAGTVRFTTNGTSLTEQMRVTHTASAVNYVQVTGAATGGSPQISAQGSDATASLIYITKSSLDHRFATNSNATNVQFRVAHTAGTIVNYTTATGNIAGSSPSFAVAGSDTDIDLTLTPKNAGNVRFGTYTASALLAVAGYITIKDSGGTTRRLLVG